MSVSTRKIVEATLFSANAVTGGTVTSTITRDVMDGYCVQANLTMNTSTSIAYMWLEASIDNTNFIAVADSTSTVSATGSVMWNVSEPYYDYMRGAFTLTTANINMTITARSVMK